MYSGPNYLKDHRDKKQKRDMMKLLVYLLRKTIYSGRTKGQTEKRINVAVDMSRSTFGCIRFRNVCFFGLGVAYTRPAEAVSSVLGLWDRVAEAGSSTDRENRHSKISRRPNYLKNHQDGKQK